MRQLHAAVREVRAWVKQYVDQRLNQTFGWTLSAKSSELGDKDQVANSDQDGGQRPVQRIEPYGLRSRVPAKVRSLWLRLGSSNTMFIGIAPTGAYGPTAIEDGETCLYNSDSAQVYLQGDTIRVKNSNGAVTVGSDGIIYLHSTGATEAYLKGTGYRTKEILLHTALTTFLAALKTYIDGIKPSADSMNTYTPAMTTPVTGAIDTLIAAITLFESFASTYLSNTIVGE